jgi:anthranilate synthase component II
MKNILIIDNYDSFVYNLYQYLGQLGARVIVKRNDQVTRSEIQQMQLSHIVLSPGPGHPKEPRDFGICLSLIQEPVVPVPVLGVCLGCQGIAYAYGANVIAAPTIVHGKTDTIRHDEKGLFQEIPQNISVMRYHSLMISGESLPSCLKVTATTSDGIIMGIAHKSKPVFGLQFHPESIGTPLGKRILQNFVEME